MNCATQEEENSNTYLVSRIMYKSMMTKRIVDWKWIAKKNLGPASWLKAPIFTGSRVQNSPRAGQGITFFFSEKLFVFFLFLSVTKLLGQYWSFLLVPWTKHSRITPKSLPNFFWTSTKPLPNLSEPLPNLSRTSPEPLPNLSQTFSENLPNLH